MAETTNERLIEAARFRQNKEQGIVAKGDEEVLERIADYMMVEADNLQNSQTANAVRDTANQIILNKSILASGGTAAEELPPEQPPVGAPLPPTTPVAEGNVPLPPV
jgi:hypothetical protein